MPFLIILLMVTVIGIPLGLLLGLGWLLTLFLAGPFAAYLLGRLIWRGQPNRIWVMLLGSVILLLAYLVPILGGLVVLAVGIVGTGMILQSLYRHFPRPAYAPARQK
jgi:hypothetical protein